MYLFLFLVPIKICDHYPTNTCHRSVSHSWKTTNIVSFAPKTPITTTCLRRLLPLEWWNNQETAKETGLWCNDNQPEDGQTIDLPFQFAVFLLKLLHMVAKKWVVVSGREAVVGCATNCWKFCNIFCSIHSFWLFHLNELLDRQTDRLTDWLTYLSFNSYEWPAQLHPMYGRVFRRVSFLNVI